VQATLSASNNPKWILLLAIAETMRRSGVNLIDRSSTRVEPPS